jgi:hypothetical protein
MKKQMFLGALLGGAAMFAWGVISHMVLPLGEVGIATMPNEAPVMSAMSEHLPEPGLYLFPAAGAEAMTPEWQANYRKGPIGMLVYHPTGREPLSPAQLLTELLSNITSALVGAVLLATAAGALTSYALRVQFAALIGLVPGLDAHVSYWNWYGFPADYTLAAMTDHLLGWLCAALVMAAIVKRRPEETA